jgi:site-specific recombinase
MNDWADAISVLLQAFIAVIAGCVLPWVKGVSKGLAQLSEDMRRLHMRTNAHHRRLRRIERLNERRGPVDGD